MDRAAVIKHKKMKRNDSNNTHIPRENQLVRKSGVDMEKAGEIWKKHKSGDRSSFHMNVFL